MNIVTISNGLQSNQAHTSGLGFRLPAETPFGNFSLKFLKLTRMLDEANRRLLESYAFWKQAHVNLNVAIDAYEEHIFANEQAVHLIRRACSEIISIIWCLSEWKKTGDYPEKIMVDNILTAVDADYIDEVGLLDKHSDFLMKLEEIENAFKHSFINCNYGIINKKEPFLHMLPLEYNKRSPDPEFKKISLSEVINEFNKFYADTINWLRLVSGKSRLPRTSLVHAI